MDDFLKTIKDLLKTVQEKTPIVQILIGTASGLITGITTEKFVKTIIFCIGIITIILEITNEQKYWQNGSYTGGGTGGGGSDRIQLNNIPDNFIFRNCKKLLHFIKIAIAQNGSLAIGFIAGYCIGFSYK